MPNQLFSCWSLKNVITHPVKIARKKARKNGKLFSKNKLRKFYFSRRILETLSWCDLGLWQLQKCSICQRNVFSLIGVSVRTKNPKQTIPKKDTEKNVRMVPLVSFDNQIAVSFNTQRPGRKKLEIVKLKHYKYWMTAKETSLCTQKEKKKILPLEKITKQSAESVEASKFRFTQKI